MSLDARGRVFELTLGRVPEWDLDVVSLRGVEELSRPYRFDVLVTVAADAGPLALSELVGRYARLTIATSGGAGRVVHGVVESIRARSAAAPGGPARYRVRVVPRLALLSRTLDTRIFQDRSVPDIVSEVLTRAGVDFRWACVGAWRPRGYCVQHQESDYSFIARLLAEEGIWYTFEHRDDDPASACEVVVFSDSAARYQALDGDPRLTLDVADDDVREARVIRFATQRAARPGDVTLRRFDPRVPSAELRASASIGPEEATGEQRLSVYDHHAEFDEGNLSRGDAARQLEQLRRRAVTASGESDCARLSPGRYFALHDLVSGQFDGEYAVTRVEHQGRRDDGLRGGAAGARERVYSNRFGCVPRALNHPPPRPARRLQQGLETAIVTGPEGEEVYTDAQGRVKVQFHWDLRGLRNERSSCWLRVAQAWSGGRHGAQFIPRVGSEVVVGFSGGDTDRPMVLGVLYNGANAPPFDLPAKKTRSGFRTESTPGGGGFNELSFEDAAGSEEVRLRAQRDLVEEVMRDRETTVHHDLRVTVGADSVESVVGDKLEVIRGLRSATVMGDAVTAVLGDARSTVDGHRAEVVHQSADLFVARDLVTRVAGSAREEVTGSHEAEVVGEQHTRVRGCATVLVGRPTAKRSYTLHVEGVAELSGTALASLSSDAEIVLRCGRSLLRLTPEHIELVAPSVFVTADGALATFGGDGAHIRAEAEATVGADTIRLGAVGASLGLDAEARLGGAKVHLGARDQVEVVTPEERPPPTRIELRDQDGHPLAGLRFKVLLPDGATRMGILNKEGVALMDLADEAEVLFEGVEEVRAT